jgi:hypothetical protein
MKKIIGFLISILILLSFILPVISSIGNSGSIEQPVYQKALAQAQAQEPEATFKTHLPFLTQPVTAKVFGVETWYYGANNSDTTLAVDTGANWIRRNALLWSDVEPNQGERKWTNGNIPSLEADFKNASNLGKKIILVIRRTPSWAQAVSGSYCGPMREDKFEAFGNFMADVVRRYSVPPYNVQYYEIWNEPEAALEKVAPRNDYIFGCWGSNSTYNWQPNDPYNGGRHFGKMLKVVYPKIKAANSNAQVVVAGLLLDCDPVNPVIDPKTGQQKNCTSAKFLEGILAEGGAPYFDVVSIHSYDYYQGGLGNYSNFNWNSAYNTTGPTLIAKTRYIKNLLANYTASTKKIFLSEIALVCSNGCDNTFQQTKANFVAQSYATAIMEGVSSAVWYHLFNIWNNSGLINHQTTPYTLLPSYKAYQFAQKELDGANSGRDISQTNIWIYEINSPRGPVWVVWSKDGATRTLTLATTPKAAYDVNGNPIPVSKNMSITINPIYIEVGSP